MLRKTASKVVIPSEGENTTAETPVVETETPVTEIETQTQETIMPEAQTKTAEVAVVAAAVPALAEGAMPSIASLKNAWEPEYVGNMFPRIVGTGAGLETSTGISLGTWVDFQVLSWNNRTFITPVTNEKNKSGANKFCRASYDGKTIPDRDGGPSQTIEEYQDFLLNFFDDSKISKYIDVYGVVLGAEKNAEVVKALGAVQMSVSPTSGKSFKAFVIQTDLAVKFKTMLASHQNCMRITGNPKKTKDGQNYVETSYGPIPMDVVVGYTPVAE